MSIDIDFIEIDCPWCDEGIDCWNISAARTDMAFLGNNGTNKLTCPECNQPIIAKVNLNLDIEQGEDG